MATVVLHDRIVPLRRLCAYPERPWMDMVLYLPKADGKSWGVTVAAPRRVWMLAPQGMPTAILSWRRWPFSPSSANADNNTKPGVSSVSI